MLLSVAIILLVAWVLGFSFHLLGGLIHVALVLAVIFAVAHFIRGTTASRI